MLFGKRESDEDREARERQEMIERIDADIQRRKDAINKSDKETNERLREIDETFSRVEEDVKKKKALQEARERFGDPNMTQTELDNRLRLENAKYAKGTGLFGAIFGAMFGGSGGKNESDTYTPDSDIYNRANPTPAARQEANVHVIRTETGRCNDDGKICRVTYYSDGNEVWELM